jgi:hypothetical protein
LVAFLFAQTDRGRPLIVCARLHRGTSCCWGYRRLSEAMFAAALIRLRLRLLQYFISRDCSCNSILQLQQCSQKGSRTRSELCSQLSQVLGCWLQGKGSRHMRALELEPWEIPGISCRPRSPLPREQASQRDQREEEDHPRRSYAPCWC